MNHKNNPLRIRALKMVDCTVVFPAKLNMKCFLLHQLIIKNIVDYLNAKKLK